MELKASPVKERAAAAGLEVLQPDRARDPELARRLEELGVDVATVVAYGSILPQSLLDVPALGFVNVHFSLLPLYRGAAPVQRAIMDGSEVTGVSIMVLTAGMDEGPVLAALEEPIRPDDTAGTLGDRLAIRGAPLLVETLERYASKKLIPVAQDATRATYAPKIGTGEARIDWSRPAGRIVDHVRGLNPVPGAFTTGGARRLKVYAARSADAHGEPGTILDPEHFVVAAGEGAVALLEVQLQGKRRMTGEEAARGMRVATGDRFE